MLRLPSKDQKHDQMAMGAITGGIVDAGRPGLSGYVRTIGGIHKAVELVEGGKAQILDDVREVLNACRSAGIGTEHDDLRKASVGRVCKIMEKDTTDGTILVHVPSIGSQVWLAAGCFAPFIQDDGFSAEGLANVSAEHVQELEHELQLGRETVQEALEAINELYSRLQKTKSDKKRAIEKFQQLRHRAVMLSRENRAQRERFQQGQVKLRALTSERDEYFEKVRELVEDNRDLAARAGQATSQSRHRH
eukprot:gnl/TRDRNA2_/TRDRNA2_81155_c0_seq1.p1 gnl/TRDRNA2_/TRDRNA2_81155_c0~~gnl/TRDRNA2_/TRDRNA2_81155_c0_seq1.p1  ORF type:complete len:249 (-),score=51.05 gnl/TRDRNA2_/TRDRNA2_81155_c0_seq1:270-1016(-)